MKKSKSYKEKESDALFAQEPESLYHLSHDTNAGLSHKKEISKVDFPGQFTEQEKKSRLKAAVKSFHEGGGISEEEMDQFFQALV